MDEIDHPEGVFFSNYMLGIALGRLGEYEPAWNYLETALVLSQRIGRYNCDLLQDMGELAVRQGDPEKGKVYLERGLKLAEEARDKWVMGMALGALGWAEIKLGNINRPGNIWEEVCPPGRRSGDNDGVTWCLEKLAELAFQNGDLEKSARILGGAARYGVK